MKKSIRHESKVLHKIGICFMLAMFLFAAGCGNKNIPENSSRQESPVNQEAASQGSQEGEQSQAPQGSQEGEQSQAPQGSQEGEQSQASQDGQAADGQISQGQDGNQANFANQPKLGTEEAKEAALKHAGLAETEVTFIKEELDYEDGKLEYDIEFVTNTTKYEYEISASDGAVLGSSQEPVERISQNQQQGIISEEEAKEAVLNHAGFTPEQVTYTKVDLEQDDGVMEYEIEFYANGKEYSGKVNASTGAIMEYEME